MVKVAATSNDIVTFHCSHFTLHTVVVTVSLPCLKHHCDNGCHSDGDGHGRKRAVGEVKANEHTK